MENEVTNISEKRGTVLATAPEHADEKYVVLKRADLESLLMELGLQSVNDPDVPADWAEDALESYVLQDAVVIRTKDVFAGPALHSYAHNIALVAHLSSRPELQPIADYFSDRAREADIQAYEDTAKLPD